MAVEITEAKSVTEGLMFWKARRRTGATYTTSSGCRYQVSGVRLELFVRSILYSRIWLFSERSGWNDERRDQLGEAVISTIEQYAPNIRKCIVGMQVISPKDIEAIAGITGGNIFHGELLLHQIFFLRPTPQWADFRTPLKGYYFGASGAHPGGGVMGAAGMLAAKEILKDGN